MKAQHCSARSSPARSGQAAQPMARSSLDFGRAFDMPTFHMQFTCGHEQKYEDLQMPVINYYGSGENSIAGSLCYCNCSHPQRKIL